MQLLMDEGSEFGRHRGLGVIAGTVERFPDTGRCKVPQVGWNKLSVGADRAPGSWRAAGVDDGDFMYFVHSYYVKPSNPETVAATSTYAGVEFCAALSQRNVVGWQFHPERSGPRGLELYRALAQRVREARQS
jgi:imidazole glycerol-phosphate synthase subunit HisH